MKHNIYYTSGTCSQAIEFDISDNNTLHNVVFYGGCNGNLQGVARLVEGMKLDEVVSKLKGISCNGAPTSCPDQLATAILQCLDNKG